MSLPQSRYPKGDNSVTTEKIQIILDITEKNKIHTMIHVVFTDRKFNVPVGISY